jgi:hypothetical protein
LKSLKIGYYILKISFLDIFGYRIGYKYPLIYILPVSGLKVDGGPRKLKMTKCKMVFLLKKIEQKMNKKLCSDPGSNQGTVEPSVGSRTRCPNSYRGIQKNPKKNCIIFYGQKTCHVFPMGLLIGSNNLELDICLAY